MTSYFNGTGEDMNTTLVGRTSTTPLPQGKSTSRAAKEAKRQAAKYDQDIAEKAAKCCKTVEVDEMNKTPKHPDIQESFDEVFGVMRTGLNALNADLGSIVTGSLSHQEVSPGTRKQNKFRALTENIWSLLLEEEKLYDKMVARGGDAFKSGLEHVRNLLRTLRAERDMLFSARAQGVAGSDSTSRNLDFEGEFV